MSILNYFQFVMSFSMNTSQYHFLYIYILLYIFHLYLSITNYKNMKNTRFESYCTQIFESEFI